ncbi:LamG-like jellyroll fold domain-containing protein [Actinoplanes sp. CA-252034]|uniref:LamG-like jellyroll fold domain-containing protein n=1 Tax=Actinoplanes sp. CA-252034 TaxID=3239906 RepID=UPI003D99EC3D
MALPAGLSVGYDLHGAAEVTPVVQDNTATYPDVLPGTDLELQTFTGGVKETMVLDSPAAANEWVFPLHLEGLTPRETGNGGIDLVDATGKVQALFPPGSMTDSRFDPRSGDMTRSSAVQMSLTTLNSAPALRVVADRTWLNDPARVYPVRVDPTVTTVDTGDVYVDNDNKTSAGDQAGDNLPIGTYDDGTTKARSFLRFDNFDNNGLNGRRVTSASLKLYLTWQYSCDVARPFYVYRVTEPWTTTALSNSTFPGPDVGSSSIGWLNVTDPGPACTNTGSVRSIGKWITVPLNVATFNDWSSGGANYGLSLVAAGTDSYAWKRFTSMRYSSGTYRPQLSITYANNVVPQVDTRYPANNTIVETLTPQMVTRAHDPDAYPAKGLTYTYNVYNSAGTSVASSGALSSPAWQIPSGKLTWNNTYYYTVRVGDRVGSSAESAAYAFSTPVPQPRLTSDLTQNPGAGFDPNNGNYTTSAVDAQVTGIGPALEISRSYNSLDTRRSGAFGQGWSSILDTKATQRKDTTGAVQTVVVTYPTGAEVAFGRNADGTFTPPSGRYAVFAAQSTGYTLTDKDATQYVFGRETAAGSGIFAITAIIDANGRQLAFDYDSAGRVSAIRNVSTGRKLSLIWAATAAPTVGAAHVQSVTTDAPADGTGGYTWTYGYGTDDRLTSVCPPGTTSACTTYSWANTNSQFANATLNLNPYSYWRLNEASGTSAESSVLTNAGVDKGIYRDVTLGGPAAFAGSGATSAGFNGTSSSLQLPGKLVNDGSYQSLSMWFRTTTANGVLFSYSGSPISAGTTTGNYVPALYVDKNGFLRGQLWQNSISPLKSPSTVTDGKWHQVVLSGAGNSQIMYLDGNPVGSLAGTIGLFQTTGSAYEYIGAGFIGGSWPDHADTGVAAAPARYFNGNIADVAFFTKTLTAGDVATLRSISQTGSSVIDRITSPEQRTQAQIAVSNVTGQVTSVTDENGGAWTMGKPTITGSSEVFAASVLGAKPVNYWRLGEIEADTTDAVNEVAGDIATYSGVKLGENGPFADSTAATFDGATSSVTLPPNVAPGGASSAALWFKTTATGKVLLGTQAGALGETTTPGLPTLWVGADGRLRGLAPSTTPTGPLRSGIEGVCIDVANGAAPDGTKVQAWQCNNTLPQSWTLNTDGTVRAFGKCLDVKSSGTANGTLVQLYTCNNSAAQVWEQYNGGLRNPNSGKCLDDPNGSVTNGTQLQINTCTGNNSQKWTMSLVSTTAVNDGKWHQAVLASSGITQSLYVDGVKATWSTASVASAPGPQPYAYLGAGLTGSGWSGLTPAVTSYFTGSLADAAFYASELTAEQVDAQWAASKQTVPVAVTTVDTTIKTITMPVKTVTVTDPGNKTITYSYDLVNNRPVAETDALGNITKYGYDTGGFGSLVYDPNGVRTQNVQDERGNTIQQITCQDQSANRCSSNYFEYYLNASNPVDPRNDVLTASLDGRSETKSDTRYRTTYSYDTKGNPLGSTDPLGRTTTTTYSGAGNVTAVDSGFVPAGLPVRVVNAAGGVQVINYYASGDIAKTVTPAGETTTYTYDRLGRKLTEKVTTSTLAGGRTTAYTYDTQGRVLTQKDGEVVNRVTNAVHAPLITNVYDADGNMTSQTIADTKGGDVPRVQSVVYNERGQRKSHVDAVGKATSFTYNAYGQIVTETDSDGGVTEFEVDAEGNVLSETMKGFTGDPNSPSAPVDLPIETRKYDPAGRLASTTDAIGRTTSYAYTDNGLTASITVSYGGESFVQERNEYDAAGNLRVQVTDNGTNRTEFEYDAAGRQVKTALDVGGENRVTTKDFSPDDNIVSSSRSKGTGGALSITDYAYDAEGRMLSETDYNGDPATTPMARWKLDQTAGNTVADSSGNTTLTAAGVNWTTDATRGAVATFDGAASVDSGSTNAVDTTRPYTITGWVKLGSKSADGSVAVLPGRGESFPFKLKYQKSTDRWRIAVAAENVDGSIAWATGDGTTSPAVGSWTHLAVTVDPATKNVVLYVNGVAEATITGTARFNLAATTLRIGAQHGNAGIVGSISDVRAYQRALSSAQVQAIKNGAAPEQTARVSRTTYNVDEGGLVTRTTDPLGNVTEIAYDEAGRPAVTTAAPVTAEQLTETGVTTVTARPVTFVGYDTFGDRTEIVDAHGNRTTYVHDRAGRVYETRGATYTKPDNTTITPVTSVEYDTLGQAKTSTDALGNVTSYTYDQLGRLAKTVAPNGGVTTAVYDAAGQLLQNTGPTGAVSAATYDFLGRKKTSTQAVRQTGTPYTTEYAYHPSGRLASVTSPDKVTSSFTYNSLGETLVSIDGAQQSTRTEYDGLGRPVKVTQPRGAYQTMSYDMLSRPVLTAAYAASGGNPLTSTGSEYDAAGNVVKSTDGKGKVTSFTYDPTGLVLSQRQPISATDAITTTFGYDLNGNRTRFTDGRGNAFWTTYNAWNLPVSTVEPVTNAYTTEADRTYTITYDAAGRAVTARSPGDVVQTYRYDEMGSLKEQTGTGAAAATTARTFGYDLAGRMTSFSAPGGTNTVTYDDRGLPTEMTGPSGNSSFAYTGDGLLAQRTDAAGVTAFGYDGAARLKTLVNNTAGTSFTVGYNADSNVEKVTYGGTGNTRHFGYDGLNRVTDDELKTPGGTTIGKISYGWDANSNETSKTTTGFGAATVTNTYEYDDANRLTSWNNGNTTIGYTYDKSGNRTGNGSTTYTYDARNRLVSDTNGVAYTYTARGTLATVTGASGAQTTTSDAFDQVISQTYGSGLRKAYEYDALGRALQAGFSYTGAGNDLAADATAKYVRDPGNDVVGTATETESRLVWTDLHDDVVGQFTATGSALTGSAVYDPLGAVKSSSGLLGSLGYQSEWTETATGRVNMAARWYNTGTGQFDSRDTLSVSPMPSSVDANRYAYGSANPLTNTDPSGHLSLSLSSIGSSISRAYNTVSNKVSSVASSVGSYATQAYSYASSYASYQYHRAANYAYKAAEYTLAGVSVVAKKVGLNSVAKKADAGRKKAAKKSNEHYRQQVKKQKEYERKGAALKERTIRAAAKVVKKVNDAAKKTVKFVQKHKKTIIAAVAMVATVAAVATLGPVGGVLASIAINVAKDAMVGDIHSLSDLGASIGRAAISGTIGAVTGGLGAALGGKAAGFVACKLGAGILGRVTAGAAGGAVSGAVEDAASQYATTGSVNWRQTADAMATGAAIGAVTGGRSRCHSFDPETRVVMADESTKPIGEVELGDEVLATDPETGETTGKPVSVLHHHQDTDLTDVTVTDENGRSSTLKATANHPFWNAGTEEWTDAADLKAGDKLRSPDGEATQTVTSIKVWTGLKWMDDLTVNDIHTYYVLAGNKPVLVHNNNTPKKCVTGTRGPVGDFDPPVNVHAPSGSWAVESRVSDGNALRDAAGEPLKTGKTRTWTSAINTRTGEIAVGCSGAGNCAEINILQKTGWGMENTLFNRAAAYQKLPNGEKSWEEMPICRVCSSIIPEENVVPGALYSH